jgi:DNA-binding beta-propeller fold protein YncE
VGKRIGFGDYQYELVEGWPQRPIQGAVADVAVDSEGRVYAGVRNPKPDGSVGASRSGVGHVAVLDRDGKEIGNWGNVFTAPHGVWVSPSDEIFLIDAGGHTVTRHAPTGEVLFTLGTRGQPGAPGAPFNLPTHAVLAPNGNIVISDGYGQNRIHRFSATGEHILSFGSGDVVHHVPGAGPPSTGPGEFNVPHDVVVDRESTLIMSDRENNRLQFFTLDGAYVSMFSVNHPNKVLIDPDGVLHLAGSAGIEVWKRDGTRLGSWGERGSEPGQFVRGSLHGAWMDAEGSVYTAEAGFNNRLQKFARV